MLHMAHLNVKSLRLGARLTILGLPMGEDDKLVIEYRNDERVSAVVVSCTTDALVITVSGTRWRLFRVELKPENKPVSVSQTYDKAITIWEILSWENSSL